MQPDIVISHEKPEILGRLEKEFKVDWDKGLIIAWDGKIHCKEMPQAQKIVHEDVHLQEQKRLGNEIWWECYMIDSTFRLEQEVMAYKAEVAFLRKHIKNREVLFHMIREVATCLSDDMYGNIVSKDEALKLLNN